MNVLLQGVLKRQEIILETLETFQLKVTIILINYSCIIKKFLCKHLESIA